jgi:hypothetical protein
MKIKVVKKGGLKLAPSGCDWMVDAVTEPNKS